MTRTAYRLLDRPVRWLASGLAMMLLAIGVPPWRLQKIGDLVVAIQRRAQRHREG